MTDIQQRIADILAAHLPKGIRDVKTRPGFTIWRAGCDGCDWINQDRDDDPLKFNEHVAAVLVSALGLEPTYVTGWMGATFVNGDTGQLWGRPFRVDGSVLPGCAFIGDRIIGLTASQSAEDGSLPDARRQSCGWLRHNWDKGLDPGELNGGATSTNTMVYTCQLCGKTKERAW